MANKIKKLIDPILLQRKKSVEQLSVKLTVEPVFVESSATEKKLYKEITKVYSDKLIQLQAKNDHDFYTISQAFVGLTRLRQSVSLSSQLPQELLAHFPKNLARDTSVKLPSKFIATKKILNEAKEKKEKTIIFTLFTETRSFLKKKLKDEGYKVLTFGGDDSSQKRKDFINKFQESSYDEWNVFIISLKSGNSGITLTAANHVIMYDLWWNSAVEAQAFSRAHRIGQTKDVKGYRLIVNDTVDVHINSINERKSKLIDSFNDRSQEKDADLKELVMDIFGIKPQKGTK